MDFNGKILIYHMKYCTETYVNTCRHVTCESYRRRGQPSMCSVTIVSRILIRMITWFLRLYSIVSAVFHII